MKKSKVLLAILAMFSFTACNKSDEPKGIQGPTVVEVGEVVKYTYSSNKSFYWVSSEPLILDISSNGEAVAFKEGNVTIAVEDSNKKVLDSLNVSVEYKINIPTSTLEISNLFNIAIGLEKDVVTSKLETTNTYINQQKVEEAHMFKDYYTIATNDSYENYAGKFEEESIDYRGIKDGFFYDLSLNSGASYAIKRKIVDSNQTDYEILRNEALQRLVSPKFVNAFYYKLAEMWGARTLDLKITAIENEKGFTLKLENTYLFLWANGVDNDSKFYEATINFSNDGFLESGEFKETKYQQTQYDVKTSTWVKNAKIDSEFIIKYSCVRGQRLDQASEIIPEDYFVQSVTKAVYEPAQALTVGGRINSDYIVLREYEKESAIDIKNIIIFDVQNDDNKTVIVKDEVNGGYVAISTGTCYLICKMMYSSEVTFLVEVTVV